MPLPRSIRECKTEEEMFSFLERTSGKRFTPGSRIVMIPVQDKGGLPLDDGRPMIPIPSDAENRFEEIVPEAGKHYSGPYLLKVLPPGSA